MSVRRTNKLYTLWWSSFLISNIKAESTARSLGVQVVCTFHLNSTNGPLMHCTGFGRVGKNEKFIQRACVSPNSQLLTLACCLSVYYDLSPTVSTGSPSDLPPCYFLRPPTCPFEVCPYFAHRQCKSTRHGSCNKDLTIFITQAIRISVCGTQIRVSALAVLDICMMHGTQWFSWIITW